MTRLFDFIFSLIGVVVLSPVLLILSLLIIFDDGLPVLYKQERIGKNGMPFKLLKFRSMRKDSDKKGLLTVGEKDNRITPTGIALRKYKLDEIPQLFNVIKGEMALVGPRPEVKKYVDLYTKEQRRVLDVKPGITDLASLEYIDENKILSESSEPEKTYIEEIMPHKIEINLEYIKKRSFFRNIGVIFKTISKIFR